MNIIQNVRPSTVIYSDVNPRVVTEQAAELSYNEDAIINSLVTIFDTPVKTRPFRRMFGTMLEQLLFEPISESTAKTMRANMELAVAQWETRVSNFTALVIPDYDIQGYYVECSFTIPALNDKPVNFNFNLIKNSDLGA